MLKHYDKFLGIFLAFSASLLLWPTPAWAIATAIGDIPTEPGSLATTIARIAFGIVSGTAVLLVLYGAIRVSLSKGDPRGLDDARATLTAALTGMVVVALAVTIMGILGVDILGIVGMSSGGGFHF
ncbi:MAG: hypothetical protein Q8N84_04440 [bacterium]|nr:hypothetical protein [bacterium]